MSKMSQLHAELSEQAAELGFESYEEALVRGYSGEYVSGKLIKSLDLELENAHEEWLKEREIVLGGLMNLMIHEVYDHDIIERAYKFIKEQCHD